MAEEQLQWLADLGLSTELDLKGDVVPLMAEPTPEEADFLPISEFDRLKDTWANSLTSQGYQIPDYVELRKNGSIKEDEAKNLIDAKYNSLYQSLSSLNGFNESKEDIEYYLEKEKNLELGNLYASDDNWIQKTIKPLIAGGANLLFDDAAVSRILGVGQKESFLGQVYQGSLEGIGQMGAPIATGAAIGSVVPGIGTAIGATVGSFAGLGLMAWQQFQSNYQQAKETTGSEDVALNAALASTPAIALDTAADVLLLRMGGLIKSTAKNIGSAATKTLIKDGSNVVGKLKFASPSATKKAALLAAKANQSSTRILTKAIKGGSKGALLEGFAEATFGTYLNNELMDLAIEGDFYDPTTKESLRELALAGTVGGVVGGAFSTPVNLRQQVAERKLANQAVSSFAKNEPFTFPSPDYEEAEAFADSVGAIAVKRKDGSISILPPANGYFTEDEGRSVSKSLEITEKRLSKLSEPFSGEGKVVQDESISVADPLVKTQESATKRLAAIAETLPKEVDSTAKPLVDGMSGALYDQVLQINKKISELSSKTGATRSLLQSDIDVLSKAGKQTTEKENQLAELDSKFEKELDDLLIDRAFVSSTRDAVTLYEAEKDIAEARATSLNQIPAERLPRRDDIRSRYEADKKVIKKISKRVQDQDPKIVKTKSVEVAKTLTPQEVLAIQRYAKVRGKGSESVKPLLGLLSLKAKAEAKDAEAKAKESEKLKKQEAKDAAKKEKELKAQAKKIGATKVSDLIKDPQQFSESQLEQINLAKNVKSLQGTYKGRQINLANTTNPKRRLELAKKVNESAEIINKLREQSPEANIEPATVIDIKAIQDEIANTQREKEVAKAKKEQAKVQKLKSEKEAKAEAKAKKEQEVKAKKETAPVEKKEVEVKKKGRPRKIVVPKIEAEEVVETATQEVDDAEAERLAIAFERAEKGVYEENTREIRAQIEAMDQLRSIRQARRDKKIERAQTAIAEGKTGEAYKKLEDLPLLTKEEQAKVAKALASWMDLLTGIQNQDPEDLYSAVKVLYAEVPSPLASRSSEPNIAEAIDDVKNSSFKDRVDNLIALDRLVPAQLESFKNLFISGMRESLMKGLGYLNARGLPLSDEIVDRLMGEEVQDLDSPSFMRQTREVLEKPLRAISPDSSMTTFANRILGEVHLDKEVEILPLDLSEATVGQILDMIDPADVEIITSNERVMTFLAQGLEKGARGFAFPMKDLSRYYIFYKPTGNKATDRFTVAHELGELSFRNLLRTMPESDFSEVSRFLSEEIGDRFIKLKENYSDKNLRNLTHPFAEVKAIGENVENIPEDWIDYITAPSEYYANQFARAFLNEKYFPNTIIGNLAKSLRNLWLRIKQALTGVEYFPSPLMKDLERNLARAGYWSALERAVAADEAVFNEDDSFVALHEMGPHSSQKKKDIQLKLVTLAKIFNNKEVEGFLAEAEAKEIPNGQDIATALTYLATAANTQIMTNQISEDEKVALFDRGVIYDPTTRLVKLLGETNSRDHRVINEGIGQALYHNLITYNSLDEDFFNELGQVAVKLFPSLGKDTSIYSQSSRLTTSAFGYVFADYLQMAPKDFRGEYPAISKVMGKMIDNSPEFRSIVVPVKNIYQKWLKRSVSQKMEALILEEARVDPLKVVFEDRGRFRGLRNYYKRSVDVNYGTWELIDRLQQTLSNSGGIDSKELLEYVKQSKTAIVSSVGLAGNLRRAIGDANHSTFRTFGGREVPNYQTIVKTVGKADRVLFETFLTAKAMEARNNYNKRLEDKYNQELSEYETGRSEIKPKKPSYISDAKFPLSYATAEAYLYNLNSRAEADPAFAAKLLKLERAAEQLYDLQEAVNDFIYEAIPGARVEIDIIRNQPREYLPLWDNSLIRDESEREIIEVLSSNTMSNDILKNFNVSESAEGFIPPSIATLLRMNNRLTNAHRQNVEEVLLNLVELSKSLGVGVNLGIQEITPQKNLSGSQKQMLLERAAQLRKKKKAFDSWVEKGMKRKKKGAEYPTDLTAEEKALLFDIAESYPIETFTKEDKVPDSQNGFYYITVKRPEGDRLLAVPRALYEAFLTQASIASPSSNYPEIASLMKMGKVLERGILRVFKSSVIKYNPSYLFRAPQYDFFAYFVNSRENNPFYLINTFFTQLPGIWHLRNALSLGSNLELEKQIRLDIVKNRAISGHSISTTASEALFKDFSKLFKEKTGIPIISNIADFAEQLVFELDTTARSAEVINWMRRSNIRPDSLKDLTTSQFLEAVQVAKTITVDYTRVGSSHLHRAMPFFGTAWNVFHNSIDQAGGRIKEAPLAYLMGRFAPAVLAYLAATSLTTCGDDASNQEKVEGFQICFPGGRYNVKFGNPFLSLVALAKSAYDTTLKDIAPEDKLKEAKELVLRYMMSTTGISMESLSPVLKAMDGLFVKTFAGGEFIPKVNELLGLKAGTARFVREDLGVFDVDNWDRIIKRVLTDTTGRYGELVYNSLMAGIKMDASFITPRSLEDFALRMTGSIPDERFQQRVIWELKNEATLTNIAYSKIEKKFDEDPTPDKLIARNYNGYMTSLSKLVGGIQAYGYENPDKELEAKRIATRLASRGMLVAKEFKKNYSTQFNKRIDRKEDASLKKLLELIEVERVRIKKSNLW